VKKAERLTMVAGEKAFVITLWTEHREPSRPPLYLGIGPEQAEDLIAALLDWLKHRSTHYPAPVETNVLTQREQEIAAPGSWNVPGPR
jgi:hypothetical protein